MVVSYEDGYCRNLQNVDALLPEYTVSRPRKVSVYCTWKYAILVSRVMRKVSVRKKKRLEFTVLNVVAILWLVVYKRALRHWWYVIVDSGLECDIYAYDAILYTTHLVSSLFLFLFGERKKRWKYFSIQCFPFAERTLLLAGSQTSPVCPFGKSNI